MIPRCSLLLAVVGALHAGTGARAGAEAAPAGRGAATELTADIVPEQWVALGATWRFFRGRTEPAAGTLDWTTTDFADGSWEAGSAGIGYGDDDDATVLSDMLGGYPTVYARKSFQVADPATVSDLELSIDFDDGFIAFLNGTEIARVNAGPAGTYPAHDDLATDNHEAGTPRSFPLGEGAALLVPGTNVLAVMGLNDSLTSSDFSLHPELRSDGPLSRGCADEFYVAGESVSLAGTAPAGTTAVRVDGVPADFRPADGTWTHRAAVGPGADTVTIEALDPVGSTLATRTLSIVQAHPLSGDIDGDLLLVAAESPYIVLDTVTVPAGRRLSIEAGCEFLISPGVGFVVQGLIQALGTFGNPVRFTRIPCQEIWGSFEFQGSRGENRFLFCEWSHGGGDPGCLTLTESDLELDGCSIRDIDGEGVHAVRCKTRIRNCNTERTQEALSLDYGDTVVEHCTLHDTIGKSDLVDANGSTDPPARIAYNILYNTSDDGIDADRGDLVIEGNVIHDCGDQAMSLVGEGTSTVRFNVCFRNSHGLSVKDSHVCVAEHNTFALNSVTGARTIEKTAGLGGGVITLKDCIVWGNPTPLLVESTGSIDVSWSDVDGAAAPGPGNINADPLFVDPAAGNFHLQDGSPCVGAASDGSDMGAFPAGAPPGSYPRGDANADGLRDISDAIAVLAFLFQGGEPPPCSDVADTNSDGGVDISDAVFLLLYLFAEHPAPVPDDARCPI